MILVGDADDDDVELWDAADGEASFLSGIGTGRDVLTGLATAVGESESLES